jgi:hypothetical protein
VGYSVSPYSTSLKSPKIFNLKMALPAFEWVVMTGQALDRGRDHPNGRGDQHCLIGHQNSTTVHLSGHESRL